MKYKLLKWLVLFSILQHTYLPAVSMVYNFRIAQITKQQIFEDKHHHNTIALLFNQYQKKYCGNSAQNFVGGLGAYIYHSLSNYLRVDAAASHITSILDNITTFSKTRLDDVLITIGHNCKFYDRTSITFSALFGVPTHSISTLKVVDFGYGQCSVGVQCDGSYDLQHKNNILYGARYIDFFPRNALDALQNSYKFTIGNIGDIFFGYKQNWTHNGLECGYTQRWGFGASIYPHFEDIVKKTNYVRSNFYFVYKYIFGSDDVKSRILLNISYGFDQKPKHYGNKYIITLWGALNIKF